MNDSVFIISLVLILTYGSYAILFLFKYSDILGKWKFLLFLVNLFLEKNKFNKKIWTLDKKLVQGVLDLYRKTQYYKRYIILDWFFHLTLIISVLVAWLISHIAYEYSFYGQDLVAPLIIFTLPLWWFIFLSVILNKFSKFKKVILKSNAFDLNNIEPLRREKLNHFKKAGKSFLMRNRGIFLLKTKTFIINENNIKEFLSNHIKSIMYIYIYDIKNPKAPYFVYENEKMIQNYEEIKWD